MSEAIGGEAILAAAARIEDHVRVTPIVTVDSEELGLRSGFRLTLKLECLQHTGSFKPRGAFNRILSSEVPESGVIAASGGNHGVAVSYAAQRLGFSAEIFVPETAPRVKVERLRHFGARVIQVGQFYDAAREASEARAHDTGALVVHAYDQPEIVAGAGTLARELEAQTGGFDTVVVAVGGGGLIGGTATWLRGRSRVVAVEPERCPTLYAARGAGRPIDAQVGGVASDSLGARRIGTLAFAIAERWVDLCTLVTDDDIRQAQAVAWDRLRIASEPGGATALAGLLAGAYVPSPGEHVVALVCGANTDPAAIPSTVC